MTKRQADLMAARRIIPVRVIELQLDKVEMMRRGMKDKMKPNRSESIVRNIMFNSVYLCVPRIDQLTSIHYFIELN